MRKWILLAALVAVASWYFHFGRKMTEASVREFYSDQTELMLKLEGEPLCRLMADDYLVRDVEFSSAGTQRSEMRRDEACSEMKQALTLFRKLSDASGGLLHPIIDQKIDSIELSENNKRATVKGVSTAQIGGMLVVRSRFTETLIRRNGRILSLGGESKTWTYGE